MTLQELLAIPEPEFLAHPEVRRVYWRALGQGERWDHKWVYRGRGLTECTECGSPRSQDNSYGIYSVAPSILGSLSDAAEALRLKVVERELAGGVYSTVHEPRYVYDGPQRRFCLFAAALGALEDSK